MPNATDGGPLTMVIVRVTDPNRGIRAGVEIRPRPTSLTRAIIRCGRRTLRTNTRAAMADSRKSKG